MRPAKYFYDKPLTKYLDPKTVLIYRPHPVFKLFVVCRLPKFIALNILRLKMHFSKRFLQIITCIGIDSSEGVWMEDQGRAVLTRLVFLNREL